MPLKLTVDVRNAMATEIRDALDSGSSAGYIVIYGGTQPSGPHIATTIQPVLSEHTLATPCGTVDNGILTFDTISDDEYANATGTATWARFFNGDGEAICDASVSVAGGGGDLQMNTVNVIVNGPVRFSSLQFTMPGG
jgi:hypothetical protein